MSREKLTDEEVRIAIATGRSLKGRRGRQVANTLERQIHDQLLVFTAQEIAAQRHAIDELND